MISEVVFSGFGKPFKTLLIDRCQPLAPLELQWTTHRLFSEDSRWSRGISGVKNFSLLLFAKIKREKLEEIPKYWPPTSGTLKPDARRGAQQAQFKAWSKYFNLKEVLHEKSNHFNLQKNSTSIYNKKQRCSLFFSFKSKLRWFRGGLFNNCLVSRMMFFTPERLLEPWSWGYFCLL